MEGGSGDGALDAVDGSRDIRFPVEEELDIEGLTLEDTPGVEGEKAPEAAQEVIDQEPVEELDLEAISRAVDEAAQEPEAVSEAAAEEEVLDFECEN